MHPFELLIVLFIFSLIFSYCLAFLLWGIWIRPFIKRVIGHSYSGATWIIAMFNDLEKGWDAARESKCRPWYLYFYTITFLYPVMVYILFVLLSMVMRIF